MLWGLRLLRDGFWWRGRAGLGDLRGACAHLLALSAALFIPSLQIAWVMQVTMGTTATETLSVAGNIFVSQVGAVTPSLDCFSVTRLLLSQGRSLGRSASGRGHVSLHPPSPEPTIRLHYPIQLSLCICFFLFLFGFRPTPSHALKPHLSLSSGISPSKVLGNHMWCRRSNPRCPCANQVLYLLYYLRDLKNQIFKKKVI